MLGVGGGRAAVSVAALNVLQDALRADSESDQKALTLSEQPVVIDVHTDGRVRLVGVDVDASPIEVLPRLQSVNAIVREELRPQVPMSGADGVRRSKLRSSVPGPLVTVVTSAAYSSFLSEWARSGVALR